MVNMLHAPCVTIILYLGLLSLIHQADQQAFGMIYDFCGRLSKGDVGIVAKGHDPGIRDLLREEISQPALLRLGVCPGVDGIAAEAMHGHDAVVGQVSQPP